MKKGDILTVQREVLVLLHDGSSLPLVAGDRVEAITVYHKHDEISGYHMAAGKIGFDITVDDPFLQHCKVCLPQEPVGSFLMLRPKKGEEVSKGGIYIPEQARNNAHQGVILKRAPDVPAEFQLGDEVVYTKFTQYDLTVDGVDIVLVNYADIILRTPAEHVGADVTAPQTT